MTLNDVIAADELVTLTILTFSRCSTDVAARNLLISCKESLYYFKGANKTQDRNQSNVSLLFIESA